MAAKRKIYRVLLTTLWASISAGIIVLLVAAVTKERKQKCTGLEISIKGVNNNFFVDKTDILAAINQYIDGSPVGQPTSLLDLKSLEEDLSKNIWIKKCQLFFDNNAMLHVNIAEREPEARVFTSSGNSFGFCAGFAAGFVTGFGLLFTAGLVACDLVAVFVAGFTATVLLTGLLFAAGFATGPGLAVSTGFDAAGLLDATVLPGFFMG